MDHTRELRRRLRLNAAVPVAIGLLLLVAMCSFLRGWALLVLLLPAAAIAWSALNWAASPHIAINGLDAEPALDSRHQEVIATVHDLARRADLSPLPQVWISASPAPNACAVRTRQGSLVCVTQGSLDLLTPRELRGVLGHEISHLSNKDSAFLLGHRAVTSSIMMILGLVAILVALMALFSEDKRDRRDGLALAGLIMGIGSSAAALLFLAAGRCRERLADHDGAALTGDPYALAVALTKIEHAAERQILPVENGTTAALCIINPLRRWFSSHPPTRRRVRWLREIAGDVPTDQAEQWFDLIHGKAVDAS